MYKRILLTIDLNHSGSWSKALPQALDLARAYGAELHVLTVVPAFQSSMVASYFPETFEAEALVTAKSSLEALIAKEVPGDSRPITHVAHGRVHEEVIKQIETLQPDLVVMASHAPDRVREFLIGSEADRVVRRSPVSVLVIRG